jgi:membrane protease YdiL (CAAX protease family)
MKMLTSLINQHALAIFCALTIALTFAATLLPIPGEVIPVVMVFLPALMAISLTALSEGKAGVQSLLGKLAQWHISLKWLVTAVALAFVMRLMVSVIALLLGLIPAIQLRPLSPAQFAILAILVFIFALPEELGWRGYALPKLLERRSPLTASLIVGVFWGSLHLALHLPGLMFAGLPPLATLLQLIGFSVLITWLYTRTGGHVLLAGLFHVAQNFFVIVNEGIPPTPLVWLMAGVYLALALIVIIVARTSFARKPLATILQVVEGVRTSQPLVQK